ncbi:energy-coupling factor transporter ATPase [Alkalibacillus salilacus]|uniref:Energy-coupling factor transporter ATP-binding protein EcfA2 n=1 Tax=Alkalibacillus salilacus TaxID=284582 RepID=A0ABT9VHD8_9BACI|nr:energy-coupling factor transporter ATPase [Alkalibacillus salilacus]MDQ0160375.1 energy-coupling factor transport system ATP-binding protein [Alkalibacillus salilacus]
MEIVFEDVDYIYQPNTPLEHVALQDLSFTIPSQSFTAIVGRTGSGKSTLLQQLNGLLQPTSGTVTIGNTRLPGVKAKPLKELRRRVGLVFQYPEHQLFEETVKQELLFGPKNFGLDLAQLEAQLPQVLQDVGLDESFLERSPFTLSGGQMKRVALASVLILDSEVLVLDEPTAGLDPVGKKQLLQLFRYLNEEKGKTVVLVTHNMEDAMAYADQLVVLNDGCIDRVTSPKHLIEKRDQLEAIGLAPPESIKFVDYMKQTLDVNWNGHEATVVTVSQALINRIKAGANK